MRAMEALDAIEENDVADAARCDGSGGYLRFAPTFTIDFLDEKAKAGELTAGLRCACLPEIHEPAIMPGSKEGPDLTKNGARKRHAPA